MKRWLAALLALLILIPAATAEITGETSRAASASAAENYVAFANLLDKEILAPGTTKEIWVRYNSNGVTGASSSVAAKYRTYLAVLRGSEVVYSNTFYPSTLNFTVDTKLTEITLDEPGTYTINVATANGTDAPDVRTVRVMEMPVTTEKLVTLSVPAPWVTLTTTGGLPISVYFHPCTLNGETLVGDALYSPVEIDVRSKNGSLAYGTGRLVSNTASYVESGEAVQILKINSIEIGGEYTVKVRAAGSSTWDTAKITLEGPAYPPSEADNPGYYCTPRQTAFTLDLNGDNTLHLDYTMSTYQEENEVYYSDFGGEDEDGNRVVRFKRMSDNNLTFDGEKWSCDGFIEYTALRTGTTSLHTYISVNGRKYDHHEIAINVIDSSHTHQWSAPAYTWASDHRSVTARRACSACGEEERETVSAGYAVALSPTENAKGKRAYTSAAFQNSAFAVQKLTLEDIPALSQMTCLKLPADLKEIAEGAFQYGDFECVIIPDGCKTIGSKAFLGCSRLRYVRIPKSAASVASNAFEGCDDAVLDRMTR